MASSKNIQDIVSNVKKKSSTKKNQEKKNTTKKTTKKQVKNKLPVKKTPAKQIKNTKKKINSLQLIAGAVIVVLIIAIIYFSFFYSPYTYAFKVNGIPHYSNEYVPTEFFEIVKAQETIYVSPIMEDGKASPIFANVLNLWQIVLISNDINAIQLIRTTDSSGNLKGCYTNFGDVMQSEMISVEECNLIIQNEFVILPEEGNPSVLMEGNKLYVFANEEIASQINFVVMSEIFPNARDALDIINETIYGLG
jgi:hypothetical protein